MTTGPQARALAEALRNLEVLDRDRAAVQLAKRYAALIDEATPASKYRDPMRLINRSLNPGDEQAAQAFAKIADALAAHSVMSDLGPKLLAVLTALGMTPAGRGVKAPPAEPDDKPKGKSDELRQRREDRERRRAEGAG